MTYSTQTEKVLRQWQHEASKLELSLNARLRLKWFTFAVEHGGDVDLTCRRFGISRSTYHRWAGRIDLNDPRTLEEKSKRPHRVRTEETPAFVVQLIRLYRTENPTMCKEIIASRLLVEHGLTISKSTIGRVIARHGFFFGDSRSHRLKRGLFEATQKLSPNASDRGSLKNDQSFGIYAS